MRFVDCAQRAGEGGNPAAEAFVSAFRAFRRRAGGFAPLTALRAVNVFWQAGWQRGVLRPGIFWD